MPRNHLVDEDFKLTLGQEVDKYHLNLENHTVVSDGYMLTLHRLRYTNVTGDAESDVDSNTPAIVIAPGIFDDAEAFLADHPEENILLAFAEEGYDVWVLNHRGSEFSRNHTDYEYKQYGWFDSERR